MRSTIRKLGCRDRMAPMIFVGTVITQLFGGSAGREGAAIQMSGSLTDWLSRSVRVTASHRGFCWLPQSRLALAQCLVFR